MNISELLILRHAIGLNDSGAAGPHGEYRNHFVTSEETTDYPHCERLVKDGFMKKRTYSFDEITTNSWLYQVTEEGKHIARNEKIS